MEREQVGPFACPSREDAAAGYKAGPANQPFGRQHSIRQHVFVIGHENRLETGGGRPEGITACATIAEGR